MTTNTKSLPSEPLDAITTDISLRLKRLPRKHVALFSASASERLSHLFEIFVRRHDLQGVSVVRDALGAVWRYLGNSCSSDELKWHLSQVQRVIPASEDYDSLESVLAQNLCIAVDSTIQSCLEAQGMEPVAGEFVIEALRAAVSHKETGFIDIGSCPELRDFLAAIVSHPIIAKEIELEQYDLCTLESALNVSSDLVAIFRRSAESQRIDPEYLF